MTESFVSLRIDVADHIAEVTLLGPGKGNRMGPEFWREMPIAFERLDQDREVRAIVLRGSGTSFSYGLDLFAMGGDLQAVIGDGALARERTDLLDLIQRMQRAISCVETCRKPVIAAVAGYCIGGGVDLATACDVRLASHDAIFSIREVKLAMVADVGTLQRLPFIVGQGVTRELAMTGDDIDAERALRIQLVNHVYPSHDELFSGARAMAKRIADNPPMAVQGTKRVLNAARGRSVEEALRDVAVWNSAFLASHDLREAIAAFAQKRSPAFRGE